jgi:hypothetical protein
MRASTAGSDAGGFSFRRWDEGQGMRRGRMNPRLERREASPGICVEMDVERRGFVRPIR